MEATDELEEAIADEYDKMQDNIAEGMAIATALLLFRQSVMDILSGVYTEVWAIGRGGALGSSDFIQIDLALSDTEAFLDGFMLDLESNLVTTEDMEAALVGNRARALMYAGGAWALYNEAKIFGQAQESMWRWDGPVDGRSCSICVEEVQAGTRPLSQINVYPGRDTICRSNCRHELVQVA